MLEAESVLGYVSSRLFRADGQCWSLHGRLAGLWVEELRAFWKYARDRAPLASAIVDFKEVTFIDQAGETLLAGRQSAGANRVATPVEHQHLLATLGNRTSPEGGDK